MSSRTTKPRQIDKIANQMVELAKHGNETQKRKVVITKKLLWENFKICFQYYKKVDFIETPETLENIGVIINYFTYNEGFYKSDRLVKKIGKREIIPGLNKSLLVIGNYGNGKTSYFEVLAKMFDHYNITPLQYKAVNAHDIVTEYECLNGNGEKYFFYNKYTCKYLYIDDVKKEKTASNYGKTEVIREILEKRYSLGLKTFITCNFREGDGQCDIEDALDEFGERYGGHLYDRLLGSYNIIQFKGKSLRK